MFMRAMLCGAVVLSCTLTASADVFTYQGKLTDAGLSANGVF